MFASVYQKGSTGVEIFTPTGKEPFKHVYCRSDPNTCKFYDRAIKGHAITLDSESHSPAFQIPKKDTDSLGIVQPLLCFQLQAISSKRHTSIEVVIKDDQKQRRRLHFSNRFREVSCNPLHAQLPWPLHEGRAGAGTGAGGAGTGAGAGAEGEPSLWLTWFLDLPSLCALCFSSQYGALESVRIFGQGRLRKIFSLPLSLEGAGVGREGKEGGSVEIERVVIPVALDYPLGTESGRRLLCLPAPSLSQPTPTSTTGRQTLQGARERERQRREADPSPLKGGRGRVGREAGVGAGEREKRREEAPLKVQLSSLHEKMKGAAALPPSSSSLLPAPAPARSLPSIEEERWRVAEGVLLGGGEGERAREERRGGESSSHPPPLSSRPPSAREPPRSLPPSTPPPPLAPSLPSPSLSYRWSAGRGGMEEREEERRERFFIPGERSREKTPLLSSSSLSHSHHTLPLSSPLSSPPPPPTSSQFRILESGELDPTLDPTRLLGERSRILESRDLSYAEMRTRYSESRDLGPVHAEEEGDGGEGREFARFLDSRNLASGVEGEREEEEREGEGGEEGGEEGEEEREVFSYPARSNNNNFTHSRSRYSESRDLDSSLLSSSRYPEPRNLAYREEGARGEGERSLESRDLGCRYSLAREERGGEEERERERERLFSPSHSEARLLDSRDLAPHTLPLSPSEEESRGGGEEGRKSREGARSLDSRCLGSRPPTALSLRRSREEREEREREERERVSLLSLPSLSLRERGEAEQERGEEMEEEEQEEERRGEYRREEQYLGERELSLSYYDADSSLPLLGTGEPLPFSLPSPLPSPSPSSTPSLNPLTEERRRVSSLYLHHLSLCLSQRSAAQKLRERGAALLALLGEVEERYLGEYGEESFLLNIGVFSL